MHFLCYKCYCSVKKDVFLCICCLLNANTDYFVLAQLHAQWQLLINWLERLICITLGCLQTWTVTNGLSHSVRSSAQLP